MGASFYSYGGVYCLHPTFHLYSAKMQLITMPRIALFVLISVYQFRHTTIF